MTGLVLLACGGSIEPTTTPEPPIEDISEAAAQIALLYHGRDSPLYAQGAAWIRSHPDTAHPALLDCLVRLKPGCLLAPAFLAEISHQESIEPLAQTVQDDRSPLARASSLALANHAHPEAIEVLIRLSRHDAPSVRARAILALGRHQRIDVCTPLQMGLLDAHSEVRYASLQAASERACLSVGEVEPLRLDESMDVRVLAEEHYQSLQRE